MSIINILTVGVPEVFLSVTFMVVLLTGKLPKKGDIFIFVLKQMITITFILFCFYHIRKNIGGLVVIAFLNTFVYALCMKLVWKFNIRQSILASSLAMFLIILSEILTVAPITKIIIENIMQYNFVDAKIIWSLPTRIMQIATIIVIYRKEIHMRNNMILSTNWDDFSNNQKRTTFILMLLILASIVFSMNYSEFYVKMKLNNIDIELFDTSMFLLLLQSVTYLLIALVLLSRTSKYENYKAILNRSPDELMDILSTLKK